jgi:hypothetical protein
MMEAQSPLVFVLAATMLWAEVAPTLRAATAFVRSADGSEDGAVLNELEDAGELEDARDGLGVGAMLDALGDATDGPEHPQSNVSTIKATVAGIHPNRRLLTDSLHGELGPVCKG